MKTRFEKNISLVALTTLFSTTQAVAQGDGICPDSIHYTLLPGIHNFQFTIANLDDGTSVDWDFGDGILQADDDTVAYHFQPVNQGVTVTATYTDTDCGIETTLSLDFNLIYSGTTALGTPRDCMDVDDDVNVNTYAANYCMFEGSGSQVLGGSFENHLWDFDDGTGTSGFYGWHQYPAPGTYHPTYIYSSNICNYSLWEFVYVHPEACGYADSCQELESLTTDDCYTFEFYIPGATGINFGDGAMIGDQYGPWSHTYSQPGTYTVYTGAWPDPCTPDGIGVIFDLAVGGDCDGDCPFEIVPFNPLDGNMCVTLELPGANANLDVTWDMGDGNVVAGGPIINYCYTNPGVYIVTATFIDDDCSTIVGMAPGGDSPPPILPTTITITVEVPEENPAACYDLTGDDVVNTTDLLIFTSYFGCTSDCNGDFDENGHINVGDLLIFISAFGIECE